MTRHREHILQSIAIATVILLISFVVSVLPAHANTFPSDAITLQVRNETGTDNLNQLILATSTLANPTRTFLGVYVSSKDARENTVYCGTSLPTPNSAEVVQDTMASLNANQRLMQYKCSKAIYADLMRTSFIGLTYVNRDISTTHDPMELGQSVATSTFVNGSFSAVTTVANSSSTPFFTQDAGNLSFLLTILISLMFLMVVGFVYNNMTNKKPWH